MIEHDNPDISVTRQAELLGISRASIYYKPVSISQDEIEIMNLIDQIYTQFPFYGARRIRKELRIKYKLKVNRKHIRRLMIQMCLEAIYPKPDTSPTDKQNPVYPYLLLNLIIDHPDQVWGTDITYIKLKEGFCYLVAIIDWYSRYVVSWQLSNSLEIEFVLQNLKKALTMAKPEIQNMDQGSHFTSPKHLDMLRAEDIRISMDGRGRCMDNIFTERLWRTVKYENVYIKSYENVREARIGLDEYFDFYNNRRFHSKLNDLTPSEVYFNKNNKLAPALTI
jgi:putative transposase